MILIFLVVGKIAKSGTGNSRLKVYSEFISGSEVRFLYPLLYYKLWVIVSTRLDLGVLVLCGAWIPGRVGLLSSVYSLEG